MLELIKLRHMLNEGLTRSRSISDLAHSMAIIILDAANEKAIYTGLTMYGLKATQHLEQNGPLLFDKILSKKGQSWDHVPGWRNVKHLHRARNAAQHEGIPPHADVVNLGRMASEKFIPFIIRILFGVELSDVSLSQAIKNSEYQSLIESAERHLGLDDPKESFDCSVRALKMARTAWSRRVKADQHNFLPRKPSTLEIVDGTSFSYLESLALEAGSPTLAFATSTSESIWADHMIKVSPSQVGIDEAGRMLAFAFWWIIESESFEMIYAPERRRTYMANQRKVRTREDLQPRIGDVSVKQVGRTVSFVLHLVNVPGVETFERWQGFVNDRFRDAAHFNCSIRDDGTVYVLMHDDKHDEISSAVQFVTKVISSADFDLAQIDQELRQLQMDSQRAVDTFRAEMVDWRNELPVWIQGMEAHLDPDTANRSRAEVEVDSDLSPRWRLFADHFGDGSVRELGHVMTISPAPTYGQLRDAIIKMDSTASQIVSKAQEQQRSIETEKASIEQKILAAINDRTEDTPPH